MSDRLYMIQRPDRRFARLQKVDGELRLAAWVKDPRLAGMLYARAHAESLAEDLGGRVVVLVIMDVPAGTTQGGAR
ncbi:hypothetical protein [Lacticaseibacillus absianus]|uniref:hypothetical protein n=1 Tax=Lacticaseibacillus absianus TaxID=2729623 RepID=UPI0015CE396A|nr:hypothetical protein [Lacticaseibacillus absianus]